jgi:hypothetical protein
MARTVRICLLTLAALALAAPLAAEEINPPPAHWRAADSTPGAENATVNWPRLAADAGELAQQVAPPPAQANETGQASSAPAPPPAQPTGTQQAGQEKTQHAIAEEQIKEQEKQRVMGVLPSFNVSYRSDAVSLTGGQKMRLAFRTAVDPVTFGVAFVVAGYHEVANDVDFGWGIKGYGQRAGAAYLDAFDGTMIGNGILPALLHQDPRYFRLGHGSKPHRLFYAVAAAVICKHDNTGKWEPNYSNVLGNLSSGAISNLYYPNSNTGVGLTISNGLIVTAEGAAGAVFQEFWPDVSRKLFHRDPTHGRDVQAGTTSTPAAAAPPAAKP